MSKFKVGDRVRVVSDAGYKTDQRGKTGHIKAVEISLVPYWIKFDDGSTGWQKEEYLKPTVPSLDNLAVDDVVVDDCGTEMTVAAVIGDIVGLKNRDDHFDNWYTVKELRDEEFTVKQDSPELTTVTLEEIAKLKGVPVEQLRIKE